jgi:hypothetical protein
MEDWRLLFLEDLPEFDRNFLLCNFCNIKKNACV